MRLYARQLRLHRNFFHSYICAWEKTRAEGAFAAGLAAQLGAPLAGSHVCEEPAAIAENGE